MELLIATTSEQERVYVSELVYEFPWDISVGKCGWDDSGDNDVLEVVYVPIGERDYKHLCNLHWCDPGEYSQCTKWQAVLYGGDNILVVPMADDMSSPYDHPFCEIYNGEGGTEWSEVLRQLREDEFYLGK